VGGNGKGKGEEGYEGKRKHFDDHVVDVGGLDMMLTFDISETHCRAKFNE
jgi:hypothetical protein